MIPREGTRDGAAVSFVYLQFIACARGAPTQLPVSMLTMRTVLMSESTDDRQKMKDVATACLNYSGVRLHSMLYSVKSKPQADFEVHNQMFIPSVSMFRNHGPGSRPQI